MLILLVDDNEINLELQKMMLESYGHTVMTADSGEKAIELTHENDFFMIFMDIHMPEMDGFTASANIRKFNQSVPIIALSADLISADDEDFIKSGMNGCLQKPLEQTAVNELLGQYSVFTRKGSVVTRRRNDIIFDYDELITVLHDKKIVLQMLRQFLNIHMNERDLLEEQISADNYIAAREILHNIIGASGNLCFRRLYDASVQLSNQLKHDCADSFESFSEIWKMTMKEVNHTIEKLSEKYNQSEIDVDWDSLWSDFKALCSEFDVTSQEIFTENINAFKAHMNDEDFEKLKTAVDCYDYLWLVDHMEELNVSGTVS